MLNLKWHIFIFIVHIAVIEEGDWVEQWHAPVKQSETPKEQVITLSSDDRTWGMLAHLSAFAGLFFFLDRKYFGSIDHLVG